MHTLLKKTSPALALLGLALGSCQPDLDAPKADRGSADFTKYVAVGNSLTAGFMDGGLYREGQTSSYPAILAEQFRGVGGGNFVQPLFTADQSNGSGYLSLVSLQAAGPVTANVTTRLALRPGATPTRPLYTKYTDPVNNLGVPGIRMSDIDIVGYGSTQGNPYFERITPDANAAQTYRARVAASAPTFFTYWLGNNDVLGYATSGGLVPVTPPATFEALNSRIIDDLTLNGAKGLVATIPNVANVPFFTTVRVADIKARFKAANPALSLYVQATGPNNTTVVREATDADLLVLTSSSVIGTSTPPNPFPVGAGLSPTQANPLSTQFVLDPQEQNTVNTTTTAYNNALRSKADSKGLAIFDSNAFFAGVAQNGFTTNGVRNTASFISGNLFSLDGVHPTPRGYAVIANEMIRAINEKYGSTIQQVNPNAYRGILIP
ncbi:SGNH/GDSL hydrolase family protein [Hymenobacter koreensis]|uniref:SGNH/GDSL hydrolase family protein n=1 Tax=Hymenobacter koreensis TaxID=1084523 RepID=A0ABP8IYC4_9BACT